MSDDNIYYLKQKIEEQNEIIKDYEAKCIPGYINKIIIDLNFKLNDSETRYNELYSKFHEYLKNQRDMANVFGMLINKIGEK